MTIRSAFPMRRMFRALPLPLAAFLVMVDAADDGPRPDILVAALESDSYGEWKADGEAFGQAPAQANMSPPNRVSGHLGERLVNSYRNGDGSTGILRC